ncbi:MAG TPA: chorismate-binding protein, partial [Chloroflexia bacterium]|nr:chorismate-binding protein [Chloroflexia bacterium]
ATATGMSFLLESVHGGEHPGRYSFLGAMPARTLQASAGAGNPLAALAAQAAGWRVVASPGQAAPLPPFVGGAVGFVSYETAGTFEPVPVAPNDPHGLPLALFGIYDTIVAFDHAFGVMQVISLAPLSGDVDAGYASATARIDAVAVRLAGPLPAQPGPAAGSPAARSAGQGTAVSSNMAPDAYEALVAQAKEHIRAGDIIQVVLSQRFSRPTTAAPFAVYRALRSLNPSPYMFYLQLGDFQLIGASPEMLVQVRDGELATHPIAGTRPRGTSPAEDTVLAAGLSADPKERAEHLMLVDLGRNDIGRVATIGSVRVPALFAIEHYSHVMHLVSHVTGKLKPGCTALDALQSCFPAGTLSGAPKVRAMQIIASLEPDTRGTYGGAVGYISASGNLDMAITIRTILLRDGVATVQAGAGIVADSVPATERAESENKARALLVALDLAEGGAL